MTKTEVKYVASATGDGCAVLVNNEVDAGWFIQGAIQVYIISGVATFYATLQKTTTNEVV